jgi:hypothetical protein
MTSSMMSTEYKVAVKYIQLTSRLKHSQHNRASNKNTSYNKNKCN